MSHTDKDRPYGVQVLDPTNRRITKPYHDHTPMRGAPLEHCSDDAPYDANDASRHCGRMYVNEHDLGRGHSATPWRADRTTRRERSLSYWRPDRVRTRAVNRLIARRYNAGDDADTEPRTTQHRHGGAWHH